MRRLCHAQPLNNRKRTRNALSRVVRSGGVVPYPHSKTVILPYANGYPVFYLMVFFLQYSNKKTLLLVLDPAPNSGVLVLPIIIAPALRRRKTSPSSKSGT